MIRAGGFFLLVTGWSVVLCALMILRGVALDSFVVTGLAVQLFGLALVVRTFLPQFARRRR